MAIVLARGGVEKKNFRQRMLKDVKFDGITILHDIFLFFNHPSRNKSFLGDVFTFFHSSLFISFSFFSLSLLFLFLILQLFLSLYFFTKKKT